MPELKQNTILVDYDDFVDGMKAMADLDSIRALVQKCKYPSDAIGSIKIILGIEVKEDE